ncbi:MAG TPA: OmpA family protein [Spirochaetota bacterium]|nr:OmpA family protein [Spirochaetota bacterium]HOL57324.1 OmpA family protein [Spirochaetota bacterium]HPP04891.1 OmpA family protein [Spirochaetota bacterium]
MKKILLLVLSFLLISNYTEAEVFKFKFVKGRKFRIEATITGSQYLNNEFLLDYKQSYKTISVIKDIIKGDELNALIEDQFYYYHINLFANNEIKELTQSETVNYIKDTLGRIIVKNNSVLPTLRNVPCFLEKDIKIGDKWKSPGFEVQDFYNDGTISIFPIEVEYTFLGYENVNNKSLAKFQYDYNIDITNNFDGTIDKRILRIVGKSSTIMLFDSKIGARYKEIYKKEYSILVQEPNKNYVLTFIDEGERVWYAIQLMDKDRILKDLRKDLDKNKIKDTEITKDDKGIKITLENIQFDPESAVLRPEEIERLKRIAEILKKYKDRGVLIIGHTTDKGTEEGRQKLSLERAKSVIDFLIKEDAINIKKSMYMGKGGKEPIAPNDTIEGMKKNRRVEIYILEE